MKIAKIGGLFKRHEIVYAAIEKELKKLRKESMEHIVDEAENRRAGKSKGKIFKTAKELDARLKLRA